MVGNGFALVGIQSEPITAFWGPFCSIWIFLFENLNPCISLFAFCHLSWKTAMAAIKLNLCIGIFLQSFLPVGYTYSNTLIKKFVMLLEKNCFDHVVFERF